MRYPTLLPILAAALSLSCKSPSESADGFTPRSAPGRVVLHRLNRAEYNATVRDLLETSQRPADAFPSDDFGYGFDNQAAVLSLSPLHIELYEQSAWSLVNELTDVGFAEPQTWRFEGEGNDVDASTGGGFDSGWNLWSNGTLTADVDLPAAGTYRFSTRVAGQQAGPQLAQMAMLVDNAEIHVQDVAGDEQFTTIEVDFHADRPGRYAFAVAFLNDYYDPDAGQDRNLLVDWIGVEGPTDVAIEPPVAYGKFFTCDAETAACAEEVVRNFAPQAWRRPVTDDEVGDLMALYTLADEAGASWIESVRPMLVAALVSPNFVFRVEHEPESGEPAAKLDDYEVASRLSYFLWGSMPDAELFAAAADGDLQDPEEIEAQVRRMLADDKAAGLVDGLAGPWLYIRAVDDASPDYATFPDWDEDLRASMKEEMRRFSSDILLGDRSMLDLVTSTDTFVDERLAAHYGVPYSGSGWQEVEIEGRPGIFSRAGLLTALSYPKRTSPVRRGKWVLGNLLCEAPPPPPPNVDALPEPDEGETPASIREQMEQHRSDPICASCHQVLDPIGFGLENFDGVGAWRDIDESGSEIDASGELPDGTSFSGPDELAAMVVAKPSLPFCMVQKTFTYALGRPPEPEDIVALDGIQDAFVAGDHRFVEMAVAIATSEPFRSRGPETDEEGP